MRSIEKFNNFNESINLDDVNFEGIFSFLLDISFEYIGEEISTMLDIKGSYDSPIIKGYHINNVKNSFKSISLYFKTDREIFLNSENIDDLLQVNDYLDKLGFEFQCIYHPSFFLYITDLECQELIDIKWNKIVFMYKVN